jgi:translation initiation factor eIF-2B subunit epsilon
VLTVCLGDDASDVEVDDIGSETGSEAGSESESDSDAFFPGGTRLSRTSSVSSADAIPVIKSTVDEEFQTEVRLSIERAFSEGHSVDNAAVELKTLRMASNVPIARVREAVIGSMVDHIPIVEGNAAAQRKEISTFIQRWGELINMIGGIDQVHTISALQVSYLMGDGKSRYRN